VCIQARRCVGGRMHRACPPSSPLWPGRRACACMQPCLARGQARGSLPDREAKASMAPLPKDEGHTPTAQAAHMRSCASCLLEGACRGDGRRWGGQSWGGLEVRTRKGRACKKPRPLTLNAMSKQAGSDCGGHWGARPARQSKGGRQGGRRAVKAPTPKGPTPAPALTLAVQEAPRGLEVRLVQQELVAAQPPCRHQRAADSKHDHAGDAHSEHEHRVDTLVALLRTCEGARRRHVHAARRPLLARTCHLAPAPSSCPAPSSSP
jgi:hypothetical protein